MHSSTCLLCVLQLWQSPKTCLAPRRSLCIFAAPGARLAASLISPPFSPFLFLSLSFRAVVNSCSLSLSVGPVYDVCPARVSRSDQALTSSRIVVVSFQLVISLESVLHEHGTFTRLSRTSKLDQLNYISLRFFFFFLLFFRIISFDWVFCIRFFDNSECEIRFLLVYIKYFVCL